MHQLLIVTCDIDRWHFRIQCLTLEKYMEPCELHVIVNEVDPRPWLDWFSANLKRHIRQHIIRVYVSDHFFTKQRFTGILDSSHGWVTQQILKLVFSFVIDQPYLVLDSKNWLIKPVAYHDIAAKWQRKTIRGHKDERWGFKPFLASCCDILDLPIDSKYRLVQTPFEIDNDIAKRLFYAFGGLDAFVDWFIGFSRPSEFMVYDLFAQSIHMGEDIGSNMASYRGYFHGLVDFERLGADIGSPDTVMISIHRRMITDQDTADRLESLVLSLP